MEHLPIRNNTSALTTATIARLGAAITHQTGLSAEAGLTARLERALRDHPDIDELARQLETRSWHEPEWQALINQVLVHETYLFRDWNQLEHLQKTGMPARIEAARQAGARRLVLWSAGCSSGEEAYSLAALTLQTMLEAGVARERDGLLEPTAGWAVGVVGSDISRDVLARADKGAFSTEGLSPFRAMQPEYAAFFPAAPSNAGPVIRMARQDLRAHLRFVHDNLLDGPPPVIGADVVVCRNVLIYLTGEARSRAFAKLVAAVAPGGYLLLGPTDQPPAAHAFEPIWSAGPVIYCRR